MPFVDGEMRDARCAKSFFSVLGLSISRIEIPLPLPFRAFEFTGNPRCRKGIPGEAGKKKETGTVELTVTVEEYRQIPYLPRGIQKRNIQKNIQST